MGPIRWPYDSVSGGTKGVECIRYIDGWELQIYEIGSLGSYGVNREVHPTAQVDVGAGTVEQFSTKYLDDNGRRIPPSLEKCLSMEVSNVWVSPIYT